MTYPVVAPFAVFADRNGDALDDGYIYIGTANQNPQTSPVSVYWDFEATIPAAQPLRTSGGYVYRNGTPANVFVSGTCSVVVRDRSGRLVYSAPELQLGTSILSGPNGSALIGFIQLGTGATARTVQAKLRDGYVNPEDFGATQSSSVDSAAALQLALNTGRIVDLAGKTFAIGSQLVWNQNGGGLIGPGNIVMLTGVGQFTNTVAGSKFASNSCGIYVESRDNVLFDNFKISLGGSPSEDNVCIPMAVRASRRSTVGAVEITGFKKGNGLISVDSSFDCNFVLNEIHDCSTNGVANGNLTGINVDDNRIASVSSKRLNISSNSITNLTVGAGFLALFGYQTDGITIANQNSSEHVIMGNRMDVVGEGIDCWGNSCIVANNSISNAYIFGVKLFHGARYNKVAGNTITAAGLGGIVLGGSSTATQTTAYNQVTGNIVNAVNVDGNWNLSTSYGIGCIGQGLATYDTRNNTISNNTVLASANTTFGLLADDGAGTGNAWYDNDVGGNFVTGLVYNPNGEIFRAANESYVLAYMSSAQLVPTGAFATVLYNTQTTDLNNEYDPTTGIFTATQPRRVNVTAQIRTAGATANDKYELKILHSNGNDPTLENVVPNTDDFSMQINATVYVNVGDTLRIQLKHNHGSDVTLTNNAGLTYVMIAES